MFVWIPILVVFFLAVGARRLHWFAGWREAGLFAVTAAGLFAVAVVELLGLVHLLGATWIVLCWAGLAAALWLVRTSVPGTVSRAKWPSPANQDMRWDWPTVVLLVLVFVVLATTFLVAVTAPPNTWDAMTYHLPRVMHWLSERSVAFYPTDIPRQNYYLPGAEYLLLHIYALAGGDRLLNLLQWAGLAGTAVAVSLIARDLGAGLTGQVLSALAAVSVPMAVLQSTSCQNDLIAAFWVCTAVFFFLGAMRAGRWVDTLAGSGAVAMAVLTKGTAFVILPVFCVFGFSRLRSESWRGLLKVLAVLAIVLAVVGGWSVRYVASMRAYGGPVLVEEVALRDHSWRCLISNAAKHAASECAIPFKPLMQACAQGVMALHERLEIAVDDARTTQGPVSHMLLWSHILHEDYAGNLFYLLVAGIGLIIALFRGSAAAKGYAWLFLAAALMMPVLIKWQPWVNRLHLPVLVLAAPLIGILAGRKPFLAFALGVVLFAGSVPYLLWNKSRPLVGEQSVLTVAREYQYFTNRPDLLQGYSAAALEIDKSGCRVVGLRLGGDSWEYPLWALSPRGVRFCRFEPGLAQACAACLLVTDQQDAVSSDAVVAETLLSSGNLQVFRLRQEASSL